MAWNAKEITTGKKLFSRGDEAPCEAKRTGRNRVEAFDGAIEKRAACGQ